MRPRGCFEPEGLCHLGSMLPFKAEIFINSRLGALVEAVDVDDLWGYMASAISAKL